MRILGKREENSILVALTAIRVMAQKGMQDPELLGKTIEAVANIAYDVGGDKACTRVRKSYDRWMEG